MSHEANAASARSRLTRRAASALFATLASQPAACSVRQRQRRHRRHDRQRPESADPVTLDFPVFYVKRPVPDPERRRWRWTTRASCVRVSRSAPICSCAIAPRLPRPRSTSPASQTEGPRRHPRPRRELRRQQGRVRDARQIHRRRGRGRSADLEHLGVRRDQPRACVASSRRTRRATKATTSCRTTCRTARIVFTSTRQRQSRAILLDENKPQYAAQDEDDNEPAFVLHVMDADGSNIHQISFNQSHDLDPAVLPNGRIVFTRWEHAHRRQPVRSLQRQSGRHRPAAAVRREQPRDRHGRSDARISRASFSS